MCLQVRTLLIMPPSPSACSQRADEHALTYTVQSRANGSCRPRTSVNANSIYDAPNTLPPACKELRLRTSLTSFPLAFPTEASVPQSS
jgi:hypothetical protein